MINWEEQGVTVMNILNYGFFAVFYVDGLRNFTLCVNVCVFKHALQENLDFSHFSVKNV